MSIFLYNYILFTERRKESASKYRGCVLEGNRKCYLYWNYGCFLVLQKSQEGKIISAAAKKQNIKNIPYRLGSHHTLIRHKQTNTNAKDDKDRKGTKMCQHFPKALPL